jgi:hypothetical protein
MKVILIFFNNVIKLYIKDSVNDSIEPDYVHYIIFIFMIYKNFDRSEDRFYTIFQLS